MLKTTVATNGDNNALQRVLFGDGNRLPVNALLTLPDGQTGVTGATTYYLSFTSSTTSIQFTTKRQAAGPVMVPFVVLDRWVSGSRSWGVARGLPASERS